MELKKLPIEEPFSFRAWALFLTFFIPGILYFLPAHPLVKGLGFEPAWRLIGTDGYFHLKYSQILGENFFKGMGIPPFPWLTQTLFEKGGWPDHHFLFHLILIPFCQFQDLILGGKIYGFFSFLLLCGSFYFVLKKLDYPLPGLGLLFFLAAGSFFWYRMLMPRVQALTVIFQLLIWVFLKKGDKWRLGIFCFFFPWLVDAFPLTWLLALILLLNRFLDGVTPDFKPLLFVISFSFLGLMINPYFPGNFSYTLHHYQNKINPQFTLPISVGMEWQPTKLLEAFGMSIPLFGSGLLLLFLTGFWGKKWSAETREFFLISLLGFALLIQARRFIELSAPWFALFSLFCFRDLFFPSQELGEGLGEFNPKIPPFPRGYLYPLAGVLTLFSGIYFYSLFSLDILGLKKDKRGALKYEKAMGWLKSHSQKGEVVFHSDWDDFPPMFFYNSLNRYIVGLDPTYMALNSENLFLLRKDMVEGRVVHPGHIIRDTFHAGWVFSLKEDQNFLFSLGCDFQKGVVADPALDLVYQDSDSVILKIKK